MDAVHTFVIFTRNYLINQPPILISYGELKKKMADKKDDKKKDDKKKKPAPKHHGGGMSFEVEIIIFLIILFIVWMMLGKHGENTDKPFIQQNETTNFVSPQ